jgi:cysteine synthase B
MSGSIWSVGQERLTDRVGNTPLIALERLPGRLGVDQAVSILVKAEWFNPGGSIKDRAALRIIDDAIADGRLKPGMTILDATSGNTGIAYAMIGASRGLDVTLVLSGSCSEERKQILAAYGVNIILSDPYEGSDGAIILARQIAAEDPERYFYADQYGNPSNWMAHYEGTGPEILAQTDGEITHFVAGLGTSGTMMGAGRRLKEHNPGIELIAVQPDDQFHGLEGLKHMDSALVPGIYDPSLIDRFVEVRTEDAYDMARRLAREEGLFVGQSAGAAVLAAIQVARDLSEGLLVTIMPDGGDKYLSTALWRTDNEIE